MATWPHRGGARPLTREGSRPEAAPVEDEPTGHTIDGTPWEEPRPPHLPDALTRLVSRVSPWVIPFLLLASLQAIGGWLEWSRQGELVDPGYGAAIFLMTLPGVSASLLGAALFYRHPDAHRRLPMLAFGVVLLALTALMGSAERPLFEWFMSRSPAADNSWIFVAGTVYGIAINAVRVFGLVYIARGLDGAPRSADVVSGRGLGILVTAVVATATVVSLASFLPIVGATELVTPVNLVAIGLGMIVTLSWSYLFVITFGGWLAGEWPRIGWLLVALAAGMEVALPILLTVGRVVDVSQLGVVGLQIGGLLSVSNWVLLLLAFAVGIPSTEVSAPDEPNAATTADPPAATRPGSAAG